MRNNIKSVLISILSSLFVCLIVLTSMIFLLPEQKDGLSAYEIAVKNGFVGTEEEWLASLKGVNGENGTNSEVTIEDIYNKAVLEGYDGTFIEFLEQYLTIENETSTQYVNESLFSVVSIYCGFTREVNSWFGTSTEEVTSAGSGVIYKLDKANGNAYIITNFHVVYDNMSTTADKISDDISVLLYGSTKTIKATFVGGALTKDIAVIKITNSDELKNSNATKVKVGNSNNVVVGSTCYAIGNPEGEGISATRGVISVDSEEITMKGVDGVTDVTFRVIRTDCAINGGNSGGGLFDSKGYFVGTVNAKIIDNEIEGIGYAIPSNVSTTIADNIIRDCDNFAAQKYSSPILGVTVAVENSKGVFNETTGVAEIVEKLIVYKLETNSLASEHFVLNDVLVSITVNGGEAVELKRIFTMVDIVHGLNVNDVLIVKVLRNNVETDLTITITEDIFVEVK